MIDDFLYDPRSRFFSVQQPCGEDGPSFLSDAHKWVWQDEWFGRCEQGQLGGSCDGIDAWFREQGQGYSIPTKGWSAKIASSTTHLLRLQLHPSQFSRAWKVPPALSCSTTPQVPYVPQAGRTSASLVQVLLPHLHVESELEQTQHGGIGSLSPSSEMDSSEPNPSRLDLHPLSPRLTGEDSEARESRRSDSYVSSPRGYSRVSRSRISRILELAAWMAL
jgi:hypothetical protein